MTRILVALAFGLSAVLVAPADTHATCGGQYFI
jgi:hypothetical protein